MAQETLMVSKFLRERPDDIQILATHFVKKFALKTGRHIDGISLDARKYLQKFIDGVVWELPARIIARGFDLAKQVDRG